MKKLLVVALLLTGFSAASFAQTNPHKKTTHPKTATAAKESTAHHTGSKAAKWDKTMPKDSTKKMDGEKNR